MMMIKTTNAGHTVATATCTADAAATADDDDGGVGGGGDDNIT